MGGFGIPPLTRGVKWLGVVTLAVTVLPFVLGKEWGGELARQVTFTPIEVFRFKLWQPFTYTFFTDDPINLLFALLGLWMIGSALEQRWGTRRFVTFYFATSALAALATALVGLVSPQVRGAVYFGNWAAVEALIAAFAIQQPDAEILLYVVPVKARWMLPLSAGMTVLYMLMRGWVPYLPQLFGLGAGILFAGGLSSGNLLLRTRMWWLDRRLRRGKLRVVRRDDDDPFAGRGKSGSDKYLH
jgi:membrane associated rhomboid family serine protease